MHLKKVDLAVTQMREIENFFPPEASQGVRYVLLICIRGQAMKRNTFKHFAMCSKSIPKVLSRDRRIKNLRPAA